MRETEWMTLVDENDRVIGVDTRENCHVGKGKMHRAFVVLLFTSDNRLLIQRRSHTKLLWPGFWDVSVTSHVYPSEDYFSAADRRLGQELGIGGIRLEKVGAFTYFAPYGEYCENEYCAILVGRYEGAVHPNPTEIAEYRYVTLKELVEDIAKNTDSYTPWFKITVEEFLKSPVSKKFQWARG